MYTDADLGAADRRVKQCALAMGLALAAMLAVYAAALILRIYGLSIAAALGMLIWLLSFGEMKFMPLLRYRRFLRELNGGLRRRTECTIGRLDADLQLQDGAHVRSLHVILPDGDSRIFYLNASKAEFLPEPGSRCTLVSYGRHIVEFSDN